MKVFESPLIGSLLAANGLVIAILASTYLMPLPEVAKGLEPIAQQEDLLTQQEQQLAEISVILERPIFHANRRKPVPPKEVIAPAAAPVRVEAPYRLAGLMGSEGRRTVYLQHTESQETISARVGDKVGDWEVESVGANFVTLIMGDERRVLELAGGE